MSIQKRSVITGILYLSLAVIGPLGFMILPNMITVEALTIGSSIRPSLVYLWFAVELLIIGIEIFLTIYLWKLLNVYDKKLSLIAFIFRLLMIAVMVINSMFILAVAVSGGANADVFIPMHHQWVFIWQILFSVHVLIVGYIVFTYVKTYWRYLGVALLLGAVGYFLDSLNNLIGYDISILSTLATIFLVFVMIGEIGMAVGLLMRKIILIDHSSS